MATEDKAKLSLLNVVDDKYDTVEYLAALAWLDPMIIDKVSLSPASDCILDMSITTLPAPMLTEPAGIVIDLPFYVEVHSL